MTYRSTVLADTPYVHFTWDDNTWANLGSNTGAGTPGATPPTTGQAAPNAGFPGTAALFGNGANNYVAKSGMTTGTSWTFETWFKRSATGNTGTLLRMSTTTSYWQITINQSSGYLRVYDSNSGLNDGITNATIVNGQWHHLAVVNSGGTITMYLDGVSIGNIFGNTGSKSNVTAWFGGESTNFTGVGAYLDETSFFNTALTSTQIAAHYQSGVVVPDVTNVAPAMTATGMAPAPVVTAIKANYSAAVPAATANGTAPAPTLALTANKVIAVGPATATGLANAAALTLSGTSLIAADNDGNYNYTYIDLPPSNNGTTEQQAWLKFNVPSAYPQSATLTLKTNPYVSYADFTIYMLTQPIPSDHGQEVLTHSANGVNFKIDFTTNTVYTFDVTTVVREMYDTGTNYGFVLVNNSGGLVRFISQTDNTPANRPQLSVTTGVDSRLPVTVTAPVATASAAAPAPVASATGNALVAMNVGTASAAMSDVTMKTSNIVVTVPAMAANVTMPDAQQFIAVPVVINIGPMTAGAEGESDISFKNQTDRNLLVFNPMSASAKMPAMFDPNHDRYLSMVPSTVDIDDAWYKLDETTGTTAHDSAAVDSVPNRNVTDAYINGSPGTITDGPEGRPAMHFDGVDDYIRISPFNEALNTGGGGTDHTYKLVYTIMDATIEFSIRTTQQNGTIFSGGAGGVVAADQGQSGYNQSYVGDVRLVNGEIVLWTGTGYNFTYKTGAKVSDGNWHHVVIALPSAQLFSKFYEWNFGGNAPFFVMLDGKTTWQRFESPIQARGMLPTTAMAGIKNGAISDFVAGDMRDLIVRLNYAVSPQTATNLYYEWSNTVKINPTPMAATAAMPDMLVHGNVKRMLALYGLPAYLDNGLTPQSGYYRDGFMNYYSQFAGFSIRNDAFNLGPGPRGGAFEFGDYLSNPVHMVYLHPKPFMLEGFMVYPVAIMKQFGSNGGPFSADGLENGQNVDPFDGIYVDDETGLPRFVDLDKDLREPVTNFDALTVVNYPAPQPEDAVDRGQASSDPLREPRQHSMFLKTNEWTAMRDKLRDSIMGAAYRGVNLWITEPWFAQHCGFIQEFDKHDTGAFIEFAGPGGIGATGYSNKRAEQLDAQHGGTNYAAPGVGQFKFTWQANAKRRIVNIEPALTDLPGYEYGDRISYVLDDNFAPHARNTAYDVIDKRQGLQVGDLIGMDMWEMGVDESERQGAPGLNWTTNAPRKYIVSAKSSGIVGKPISKEMEFYYGINGRIVDNKFKDNVYTIIAERGSVVRGQAIKGRAFIEFMDPSTGDIMIAVDAEKNATNGTPGGGTTWDFDERRYREISTLNVIPTSITRTQANGDKVKVFFNVEQRYLDFQAGTYIYKPRYTMNARGLNWLLETETVPAGDVKVYIPAMNANASAPIVIQTKQRSLVVNVTHAEAYAEVRNPQNYKGNDFVEHILPARADAKLNGIGNTVMVGAATASATMLVPNVIATGDKISVYMDAGRNVTLFMKED